MFRINPIATLRRAGIALAVLAAVGPASAGAATVEKTALGNFFYDAAPGENNSTVVSHDGGFVVFEDVVPVTAGQNCQQITPTSAKCDDAAAGGVYVFAQDGTNVVNVETAYPAYVSGAGATKNTFYGGTGVNSLYGGDGDDRLYGGLAPDTIEGGDGNDEIRGFGGDDDLSGGAGFDLIDGGDGKDALHGGDHNDVLDGGAGPDTFDGGAGTDRADYSARVAPVTVTIGSQLVADDGEAGEGDHVLGNVEDVTGGAGDDFLSAPAGAVDNALAGGAGDDRISGGGGDDSLSGGPGADLLQGGQGHDILQGDAGDDTLEGGDGPDILHGVDGDDLLDGGAGNDFLNGGAGTGDTVTYAERTAPVSVDLDGVQFDDGEEGEGDTVSATVERIVGGSGDDTLVGNAEANVIRGGAGNDSIDGLAGPDQLLGEAGDDSLESRDGEADTDDCGDGSDVFAADAVDTLIDCEPKPAPPGGGEGGDTPPTGDGGTTPGATAGPLVRIGPSRVSLDRRGYARLRVSCPSTAQQSCIGTLKIQRRVRGRTVTAGSRRFSVAAGRSTVVKVRVTRATRRSIGRRGLRVSAVASVRDVASATRTAKRDVRILRARR